MNSYATALSHISQYLPALLLLLGSLAALMTALAGIGNAILGAFPSLKGGRFDHLVNLAETLGVDVGKARDYLRKLFGSPAVTAVLGAGGDKTPPGGSPPGPKAAVLVAALLGGLLLAPAPARAQDTSSRWSYGPSIPLVRFGLGAAPVQLQPGLGLQGSYRLSLKWTLDLAAIATVLANPFATGIPSSDTLSLAPFACYGADATKRACAGLMLDLLTTLHDGLLQPGRDAQKSIGIITSTNFDLVNVADLFR